jgi:hypothetical protein
MDCKQYRLTRFAKIKQLRQCTEITNSALIPRDQANTENPGSTFKFAKTKCQSFIWKSITKQIVIIRLAHKLIIDEHSIKFWLCCRKFVQVKRFKFICSDSNERECHLPRRYLIRKWRRIAILEVLVATQNQMHLEVSCRWSQRSPLHQAN